jgi:DNA-binding SARP family transcriptional activator
VLALVADARRPVAIDTLINRVWDDKLPANPRAVLYWRLSRIRWLLGPAVCVERSTNSTALPMIALRPFRVSWTACVAVMRRPPSAGLGAARTVRRPRS